MKLTRLRSSRTAILPIFLLIAAMIFWPTVDRASHQTGAAQGVSWLSSDSISYLTSSGIPVMVPSWLPSPVAGTTPEIYAGGGSYSVYFYAGNSFLYITGVAGGGFPGGSEANLNVELSVNSSVLGYPAIHDLGIPEGSDVPIYDKVMWIADGVFYTVSGNGIDADSVSLANSSTVLYPQAPPVVEEPVYEEPVYEEPVVEEPAVEEPVYSEPTSTTGVVDESTEVVTSDSSTSSSSSTTSSSSQVSSESTETSGSESGQSAPEPTSLPANGDDGTGGPWYTGNGVTEEASDGTSGAVPPFLGGDGTGGAP